LIGLGRKGLGTGSRAHLHHSQNFTAGIAGLLSLFPADKRPSGAIRDVVASSVKLETPFGMTIAMASVYSGAFHVHFPSAHKSHKESFSHCSFAGFPN
jgi:hypothetical protein